MNIGILGAGNIAGTMARTLQKTPGVTCYAVAARDIKRAEKFAEEYHFEKAYGSYEEMVADEKVELIYIATPHSYHYEHAKLCIENKKPVLCEKPFTVNVKQAEELFQLARENEVFITEAFWSRFLPIYQKLNDLLKEGIIGTVSQININFGFPISRNERMEKPELAGGALLDLGVYPLHVAAMVLGDKVENIISNAVLTEKGVDAKNTIVMTFQNKAVAILTSNMEAVMDNHMVIAGEKGTILVDNLNNPNFIQVKDAQEKEIAFFEKEIQVTGYEYEVIKSVAAIKDGKYECEEISHKETLRILKIMDACRKEWGLKYPFE